MSRRQYRMKPLNDTDQATRTIDNDHTATVTRREGSTS